MRIIRWLLFCCAALAVGQVSGSPITVTGVSLDESTRTLTLNLSNQGSAAVTAYHILVTQDCPEGKFNGTDAVMRFLPVLHPEEIGDWYQSTSDNAPIRPGESKEIAFRLDRRETSKGPCSGANVRAVTAVFADGESSGSPEIVKQILDRRRGESAQYAKWLEPLRSALAAEQPQAALTSLQSEIEKDQAPAAGMSDDEASGASSARRDILSRVKHLVRLYVQNRDGTADIGEKMLLLHELRSEALGRY